MNHDELKAARETLGLTGKEAAALLDLKNDKDVFRYEASPDKSMHRTPPPRLARLYQAYLSGYRPPDWPKHLLEWEERKRQAQVEIREHRT